MIKSHHSVGGQPEDMQFELVEPLRELFKGEVGKIGLELGLPYDMVYRHPFPGPILGTFQVDKLRVNYMGGHVQYNPGSAAVPRQVYVVCLNGASRFRWVTALNLRGWRTPSPAVSAVRSNGKTCWNETPISVLGVIENYTAS